MTEVGQPTLPSIDLDSVRRTVELCVGAGQVTEIRALQATLKGNNRNGTVSGYFDSAQAVADTIGDIARASGIYFMPNPVLPALMARASNRLRLCQKGDPTTSDPEIVSRRWLLVDCDPVRPTGISSTDAEHDAALGLAGAIRDALFQDGWPLPIIADSGNGGHLLYRIDLPCDDGGLVQRVLEALATRFDRPGLKVDTVVQNPARIWKLYGTLAAKGDSTEDRPHRMSRLIDVPDVLAVVPPELLEKLAGEAPIAISPPRQPGSAAAPRSGAFSIDDWVARHLPDAHGPNDWKDGGRIWTLPVCPFNESHAASEAFVGVLPGGAITAGCHHNSCSHWGWSELREKFDPAALRVPVLASATCRHAQPATPMPLADFTPICATSLIDTYPSMRPVLIEGLLRQGETLNIIAAPKTGKSWLVHLLALSIATGRPWLGRRVQQGPVILIDGELHLETLARRIASVSEACTVALPQLRGLEVWPVRGRRVTIDDIAAELIARQANPSVVILDALYRFMPIGAEENSNEAMTQVYNMADFIARMTGAAVVIVHHASKGSQADKSITDIGAGAGAQSRAADTHLVLRRHEEEGAVVVDAAVRSFSPLEPFVIAREGVMWEPAPDLDPTKLYRAPSKHQRKDGSEEKKAHTSPVRPWDPQRFAAEVVGVRPSIRADIDARGKREGLTLREIDSLLRRAEDSGLIARDKGTGNQPHRFFAVPTTVAALFANPTPSSSAPTEGGGSPQVTPAPSAAALGGVGGTYDPPPPPFHPPQPTLNRGVA